MLYKIAYWIGDNDGKELELITEVATTDARFASDAARSLADGLEARDRSEEQIAALELKVSTLNHMLNRAQEELDLQTQKLGDAEMSLTELAPARSPRFKEGWEPEPEEETTPAELWGEAKARLEEALGMISRNAAEAMRKKAEKIIDEQSALAANLQKA